MSNIWSKISSIIGGNDQHYAGRTVAISGDGQVIAVGQDINSRNLNRGPIFIYKRTGDSSWAQVGSSLSGEEQSKFGSSISLSKDGKILAIGAPDSGSGYVEIYKLENNNWVLLGNRLNGTARDFQFGKSVSLSDDGNLIAIGSPNSSTGGQNNLGTTRVFRNNNGSWVQQGQNIYGDRAHAKAGYSVSLSSDGTTLAIGRDNSNNGIINTFKFILRSRIF